MNSAEAAELARQGIDLAKQGLQDNRLLDERLKQLAAELGQYELLKLRERVAVLEAHVADLKKAKEESDKRPWLFICIGTAAVMALVGGLISFSIQYLFKKP